ncbi:partial Hercynine oxygenase, partial [Gammaproteobacteria bacterium]
TWKKTPIVVTSRPSGYQDRSVLAGFEPSHIEPLSDRAVETFLDRWSLALHPTDSVVASAHRRELLSALNARPTIRRLARNTVMLTALAVVHWNEKRLPEQRAELYESIVLWLARSREQRPGRPGAERSLEVLRALALAMFTADGGRQVQLSRHGAAEYVQSLFQNDHAKAETFLEEEELDSGIIVRRGNELRFWHLSFQEYLAARAIGGLSEERQKEILLGGKRVLFEPEWREVGQLLGGVLYEQGREKVDGLVKAVLADLYRAEQPPLVDQARVAGLLGGIVRDLAPFQYAPADPRYREVLGTALGIFDKDKAGAVPVAIRIEAAEALGQAGDPRLIDKQQYWVYIQSGSFWMGAQNVDPKGKNYDLEAFKEEGPVHKVGVLGFYFGRWPVTVQEFSDFIEDDGYANKLWWQEGGFGQWKHPPEWDEQLRHPNRPVVGISWFEAVAYCSWRTFRPASTDELPIGFCIRLPTEAEWEWAARGSEARLYPWGQEGCNSERLNFARNIFNPTPVGVYPNGATPEGILDLAGNAWEWCLNWQGTYGSYASTNSTYSIKDQSCVMRGGSWVYHSRNARSAYRYWSRPSDRNNDVGFRLVCASPITVL